MQATVTLTHDLEEVAREIDRGYAVLRQAAEMFKDHQAGRMAQGHRIRSMSIDASAGYAEYAASMKSLEDELSTRLVAAYREVAPRGVQEWAARTSGIGRTSPHMLARLLGRLGHPRLAIPKYWVENDAGEEDAPKRMLAVGDAYLRTISQLWQFCGHGEPKRLHPGMDQDEVLRLGDPSCKSIVHLLSENVMKAQVRKGEPIGELGALFLETKERYRHRGHNGPCPGGFTSVNGTVRRVRCKVDGRYAEDGDPFQPSHIQAIALRRVGKEILRELWIAAEEPWSPPETYTTWGDYDS